MIFTCASCSLALIVASNECQLDSINVLEPDNFIESEAGYTETWNPNHPELRCAGVAVIRRTINAKGLHLPSYVNFPELHFIVQGKGVLGIAIPGCPETYEEPQEPRQQQQDRHQKVRYLNEGDIVAIPTGMPYWTYNYGDTPLVVITLLYTTSFQNQLDPIPRRFYLAGNPEEEHQETQKEHHKSKEGKNVFSGFEPEFLGESLNVNEGLAKKLQCPHDKRNHIIEVKRGLSIIIPPLEQEQREEEEEHGHGHGQHKKEGEEEEVVEKETRTHRERHEGGRRHGGQGEEEEEKEVEEKHTRTRERKGGKGQHREEEEEEEEEVEHQEHHKEHKGKQGREEHGEKEEERNLLLENVCTLKLHENIANPSRADFFNPRAGRISTINSFTLPILKWLQLSAEWVYLYKNAIYAPHWNINSNSVIYVTRGEGHVQIVNCQGNSVFNGKIQKGQLLMVPQNFVLAKKAGSEGLEYIAFKTNDRAMISILGGRSSALSAIPAEVLQNAFGLSPQEVSALKNNRNEGVLVSPSSRSKFQDAYITMV
ncbi:hypothetical protein RIF29_40205 [Crotalaria pallida]|uniref:Cupin type-1 domain-containing protein n=1 Tax=Crotalaria pallida TaxID=3830 RepID=A0AAN9E872_CROPI